MTTNTQARVWQPSLQASLALPNTSFFANLVCSIYSGKGLSCLWILKLDFKIMPLNLKIYLRTPFTSNAKQLHTWTL
jgi:hypothetical protein